MSNRLENLDDAALDSIVGGEGGEGFDFVQVNGSNLLDADSTRTPHGYSGNDLLIGGTGRDI